MSQSSKHYANRCSIGRDTYLSTPWLLEWDCGSFLAFWTPVSAGHPATNVLISYRDSSIMHDDYRSGYSRMVDIFRLKTSDSAKLQPQSHTTTTFFLNIPRSTSSRIPSIRPSSTFYTII
jgi:hypothetical protein